MANNTLDFYNKKYVAAGLAPALNKEGDHKGRSYHAIITTINITAIRQFLFSILFC